MKRAEKNLLPEYMEFANEIRKSFGEGDAKRDAGLTRPEDVAWENDICYKEGAEADKWNLMDIYYPKNTQGLLPVIVSVHGGAWCYGDKEVYQFYGCQLAQHGFAFVNFNYHLAPEYPFPAALEDVNAVFNWIEKNGKEHHIDPEKIFAVGDSAGAHLLALYMTICSSQKLAGLYDEFKLPSNKVKAIALNCGRYSVKAEKDTRDYKLFQAFFNGNPEDYYPECEVLENLSKDFPPAFIMSAHHDFLLEHAKPMCDAINAAGGYAECHIYGSPERKDIAHVFHCNVRMQEGRACNDEECAFFKRYL